MCEKYPRTWAKFFRHKMRVAMDRHCEVDERFHLSHEKRKEIDEIREPHVQYRRFISELYPDTHHTYFDYHVLSKMIHVHIPVMILHARDDEVVQFDTVMPFAQAKKNQNLILAYTDSGGHIGWYALDLFSYSWSDRVVVEFLRAISDVCGSSCE